MFFSFQNLDDTILFVICVAHFFYRFLRLLNGVLSRATETTFLRFVLFSIGCISVFLVGIVVESVADVTTVNDSEATDAATCEEASSSSSIQLQSVRTDILSSVSSVLNGGGGPGIIKASETAQAS